MQSGDFIGRVYTVAWAFDAVMDARMASHIAAANEPISFQYLLTVKFVFDNRWRNAQQELCRKWRGLQ